MKRKFYSFLLGLVLFAPAVSMAQYNKNYIANTGLVEESSAYDIIFQIVQYVLGFLAILATLIIVIAGIMYITAGGDEDRVENAKRWLLYAIIGLTVALLGFVIVMIIGGIVGAGVTGTF